GYHGADPRLVEGAETAGGRDLACPLAGGDHVEFGADAERQDGVAHAKVKQMFMGRFIGGGRQGAAPGGCSKYYQRELYALAAALPVYILPRSDRLKAARPPAIPRRATGSGRRPPSGGR